MLNYLYPLTFSPYLKEVIWGGKNLLDLKQIDPERHPEFKNVRIGETWEIADLPQHYSQISNGPLRGMHIHEAIDLLKEDLLGSKGMRQMGKGGFPLLVKFIDAHDQLSIQVHPNDSLARKFHGEQARGKTEMWYIIDAAPGAAIYCGLKESVTEDKYLRAIAEDTIEDILVKHYVKKGDVFFIPAGRVHSIGAGCLLAEIQQSSDYTYRIYDFKRKDKDGRLRELHTDKAAKAINYKEASEVHDYKLDYDVPSAEAFVLPLLQCPYFGADLISVSPTISEIEIDLGDRDSFTILQCTEGSGVLVDAFQNAMTLVKGQTVLMPAAIPSFKIVSRESDIKILETYIP